MDGALDKYPSMNKFYIIDVEQDGNIVTRVKAAQKEAYNTLTEQFGV